MNKITTIKALLILFGMSLLLHSCSTPTPRVDYQALAKASVQLNMDINLNDDHKRNEPAAPFLQHPHPSGRLSGPGKSLRPAEHGHQPQR